MPKSALAPAIETPTGDQLKEARRRFQAYEPRDLFYRVASELIELALVGKTRITVAEALAVLLQTWNAQYYQFRPFTEAHFHDIEELLRMQLDQALTFRGRSIDSTTESDLEKVEALFTGFEKVLGPVGAAKSLHLLAPTFFPLWDREIAKCYRCELDKIGSNGVHYVAFFLLALEQVRSLLPDMREQMDVLKRIDEFNYCRYTKKWM